MFCFQPVRFSAPFPHRVALLACLAAAAILTCGAAWADEEAAPAEAAAKLNFMSDVWPILSGRCVECHGPEKQKGDLRLDSPESIQKGSSFGPVIEAGNPDGSVLIELISLPADDADIMPAQGDPLAADQIALLRRWVEEGATFEGWDPAAPAPMPDVASADSAVHEASPDAAPPVEDILTILAKDVPQPDEAVLDAVKAHGALAMRLGQNTPLVRVNYQRARDEFDPELLQSLAPLAPQLTWLNLAGTGVQDEHLALLAPLTKLTSLHLERTDITDAGLVHLKDLTNLRYLNLYDTNITDAGLENLKGLTNLDKLYLWQTQVTPEAAEALKQALPNVVINLGSELQTPAVEAAVSPEVAKLQLALLFDAEGCCATALAEGKACEHPCCIEAAAKGEVCAKCNPGAAAKQLLIARFDEGGCCATAYAAGKACDHPCCIEAWAKGEVCAKCNPKGAAGEPAPAAEPEAPAEDAAVKAKQLALLFDVESCCAKASAEGKCCEHPCCVEAAAAGEVCGKCNPGAAAKQALICTFDAEACCATAFGAGAFCEHPCCVEAWAKGEVCAKCNPKGAAGEPAPAAEPEAPAEDAAVKAKQLALLFDAESCCAKASAEGKCCEHPCCVEAAAAGEVCGKCNPGAAAKQALICTFDAEACCATAFGAGAFCEHPCCVEAWAKGEVCAKCNPGAAPEPPSDPAADLAARFDEGSCCFAAHAQGTACPHPCCVEALAKLEVCTKCNPGAAPAPAAEEAEPPAAAAEEAPPPGDAPQAEPAEPAAEPSSDQLAFNRDIRPILSHNCFLCHGPDKNMRKSGLRLDIREEAVAPRDGAYAIFPGDISQSELVRRITSTDPDFMMPPPASERSLKPEDVATLTAWVEQGAAYQPHWAYIAAARPQLPQVADAQWPANAIDHFVLARLEQKGLTPSPEADRATLIRRLSFDLIGLPPTPAEVDAFLNDSSDNAYENLVDRLLASPHFGERMAVDWLDQVRYADTNGFHSDEYRSVWPYRDYVINAFNTNKPFDQFTIEQLAGDLLPGATTEQKVASAYNRLNQLTAEGGAQPGEYLAKYAADRVRTAASVWMGATMGCAECHDHKFDPYTTRDFYSMEAFFADIEEVGVYGGGSLWEPILRLPSPEQEQKLGELDADLARLEQLLTTPTDETRIAQQAWETATQIDLRSTANNWTTLHPATLEATGGTVLAVDEQGVVLAGGENPATSQHTLTFHTAQRNITGIRLSAIAHPSFNGGLSRVSGNFILTTFEVEANGAPVPVASAVADFEQENWPVAGALDDNPATGWAVAGHERRGEDHAAVFRFAEPVPGGEGTVIMVRMKHESAHAQHSVDCFTLAFTTMAQPDLPVVDKLSPDLRLVLDKPETERTDEEAQALAKHYLSVTPEFADERAQQAALMEERTALINALPYTLVTQVREEPRTIRILPRGNWMDESGDIVEPHTPGFLPPLEVEGRRATRLDLAHWLVSPENPLTARVQVNRFWKLFFGTGLSKTLDDLGNQGEWPTHPDLIDWLAVEFRESGWDVKHTIKLIVMSNTYRQASLPRDEVDAVDPRNRLLARQSRFRLEAELVRDNALAVSGLLSEKMGGPSVYPYQPDGYWDNCNTFRGPLIYTASEGEDQYRRGLYTIWKRSFLHPSMIAFDAPNREECVADRTVSNTPLQALVLLNDPSYIEAARVFAERILAEGGETFESRLEFAFKHALSRAPRAAEIEHLRALCEKHAAEFNQSEEGTVAFVSTGQAPLPGNTNEAELAAWTSLARVIFNLHETITRS